MKKQYIRKNIISILIILFITAIIYICININAIDFNYFKSTDSNNAEYQNNVKNSIPEFYGTVAINLKVGDTLDLTNSVFRIFAKDFYDGDLTHDINIISNNVNTSQEGNYSIKYSVTNTSGNTAEIEVPVVVNSSQERTVQRKLYAKEDTWNMDIDNLLRGNYHDRQNLGIYLESGANLKVRLLEGQINLKGELLNDDQETESEFNISTEWTTITSEYDSVPFIKTSDLNGKKITYQNSYQTDYGYYYNMTSFVEQVNNTIYFGNMFEKEENCDKIDKISIPVYGCDELDVYLYEAKVGAGGATIPEYSYLKKIENPTNGYATIKFEEPLQIDGEMFGILVRYTGDKVPMTRNN